MVEVDGEDADSRAALAMSPADEKPISIGQNVVDQPSSRCSDTPTNGSLWLSGGLAALDRKAMERERLARLASRKRERDSSISPPSARNPRKAPKLETTTVDMPSGARLNMFSTIVQQDQSTRKSETATAANANLKTESQQVTVKDEPAMDGPILSPGGLAYPDGAVKKTWAFGHQRTGDDVKLEEVLEPRTLRTAVLSAFQWDPDWVLSKLKVPSNGGNTKCVFIMQGKDEALRHKMIQETEGMRPFLRLCFPPMPGAVHCMHSKLMLLFHPEKLRIAIPSANLLNFDWGETGMMENSVFIIDLPRHREEAKVSLEDLTSFGKELVYFLEKQTVDQDIRDGVLNFDFSATSGMAFVHTVGGIFYDDEAERTGLPGLGRAVRDLGQQAGDLEIDFAASSIGSLNDDYLRALYTAAKGEDLIARSDSAMRTAKADFFKPVPNVPKKVAAENIRDKIRIYFPTHETVTHSTARAAGTICFSRKWYENISFPRSIFRDYVSVRPGLLSHNKILYARGKRRADEGTALQHVAWVYVGSANMSESAWGKLVYDKKAKGWKINCRNWECGVLLPVPPEKIACVRQAEEDVVARKAVVTMEKVEGEESETESEGADEAVNSTGEVRQVVDMRVFDGLVGRPFEYPGRSYDGREPWYFQERPR